MEKLAFHNYLDAFSEKFTRAEKLPPATKKQREWIVRAWDRVFKAPAGQHVCGFPVIRNEKFYLHGFVDEVQVYHLIPRGFASFNLGWHGNQVNSPFNLVPMCRQHGLARKISGNIDPNKDVVPALYPDIEQARITYDGNSHPNSYDAVMAMRADKMRRHEPYWNTDFDQALARKAKEVYYRYLQWQLEENGKYFDSFPWRHWRF